MGLVHLFNIFDSWDDFDDYRKVFWLLWLTLTTATAAKTSLLKWIGVFSTLSRLFQTAENIKYRRISLELISWGPHSSFERERKIRYRLFTSSIKREIRDFHAVVVQWRQRNVQKNVLHVQSCCFANQAYCFFDVLAAVAVVVAKAPYCVAGSLGRKNKKARGTRGREAFPSSHRPPRSSYFSIIAIFIEIPSRSLCGGENCCETRAFYSPQVYNSTSPSRISFRTRKSGRNCA